MKNTIKDHRDLLSILLGVIIIPGIWILQGAGIIAIPEIVLGATISIETGVATFYFSKADKPDGK